MYSIKYMYLLFFNTEEFCHFKEISPLLNSAFVMLNTQKRLPKIFSDSLNK